MIIKNPRLGKIDPMKYLELGNDEMFPQILGHHYFERLDRKHFTSAPAAIAKAFELCGISGIWDQEFKRPPIHNCPTVWNYFEVVHPKNVMKTDTMLRIIEQILKFVSNNELL
jgi:hypothetical protein